MMSKRAQVGIAALVVVVGLVVVLSRLGVFAPGGDISPRDEVSPHRLLAQRVSQPLLPAAVIKPVTRLQVETVAGGESGSEQTRQVVVRGADVLAVVNGVPLTLKDIVGIGTVGADVERRFSPEVYDMLLNRAIERELTFMVAQKQGVELSDAQAQQLQAMLEREERVDPDVFDKMGRTTANTEFNLRDASALMLQANLYEQGGGVSRHVNSEDVQAYYAQHAGDWAALPAGEAERKEAWAQIELEIRKRLMGQKKEVYDKNLKAYLDQLKAGANIQLPEANAAGVASGG